MLRPRAHHFPIGENEVALKRQGHMALPFCMLRKARHTHLQVALRIKFLSHFKRVDSLNPSFTDALIQYLPYKIYSFYLNKSTLIA